MAKAARARERNWLAAAEGKIRKSCVGEPGFVHMEQRFRVFQHIGDDYQAGEEAHDYGVPEYGGHGYVSLPGGILSAGSSRRNGGSADASLVGKESSGNAISCRLF